VCSAVERLKATSAKAEISGIVADCASTLGASEVFARLPAIDILVNNLGVYEKKGFFDTQDEDWLRLFEVNVLSGIRFSRNYAPDMALRGWGRILFVSSESALNIPREMIHYGMTKTAQLSISRGLAIELAATGVTVNSVLPGPTHTESTDRVRADRAKAAGRTLGEIEADVFRTWRSTSLLKRLTSAEEVANLAVYLCGQGASGTTGAALRVDGGIVNQIM
jgi:NAD(P)-dependent dehydrogenase (short-subunit alcohol dehydrogenase family)